MTTLSGRVNNVTCQLSKEPGVPPSLLNPSAPVTRDRAVPLERVLLSSDYDLASGRIDVSVGGVLVNSCAFTHAPAASSLSVHCSVEGWTYTGDARRGRLEYPDGRTVAATSASEIRDVPNWLLCPSLAPIWGRPGERWRLECADSEPLDVGHYRVPLVSVVGGHLGGFADVVWPEGYLSLLVMGEERYLLRSVERVPHR